MERRTDREGDGMGTHIEDLVGITQCRLVATTNQGMHHYVGRGGIRGDYVTDDGRVVCFFVMGDDLFFRTSPGEMERPVGETESILLTGNSRYVWEDGKDVEVQGPIRDWMIAVTRGSSPAMAQMMAGLIG